MKPEPRKSKSTGVTRASSASSSQNKRPDKKPLFTVHSRGLMAYWYSSWYPITIVQNATRKERGVWMYEIRWTGYENAARAGQLPTNESTYPESWIIRKTDIATLPTSMRRKSVPSPAKIGSKSSGAKGAAAPAAAPAVGSAVPRVFSTDSTSSAFSGLGFGSGSAISDGPAVHKYKYKWQFSSRSGFNDYHPAASDLVEEAFQSWVSDPHIDVRAVKSGNWEYMVDFNRMEQTNIGHANHRSRQIRRVPVDPSITPEEPVPSKAAAMAAAAASSSSLASGPTGADDGGSTGSAASSPPLPAMGLAPAVPIPQDDAAPMATSP